MNNWVDIANFAVSVSGLTIAVLGFLLTLFLRNVGKETRSFFTNLFGILILYTVFVFLSNLSSHFFGPKWGSFSKTCIFFHSLFSSLLIPLLIRFMQSIAGEDPKRAPLTYLSNVLWGVYFVLLVITQATTKIYYITDANEYHRGPYYPILLVPLELLMATALIALYRRRNKLTAKQRNAFLFCFLLPLLSMFLQMLQYGLFLTVFGTTSAALFMFLYILDDQMDKTLRQMEENAHQRTNILMLQMRPHFIYNTMSSIYYLCKLDPEKAQQLVGDFTTYLRKNFSALAKENLIPFEEELEHTQAYLSIEKARFEKLLFVEYEISHTAFRLPPLTLQPIVENAVKHGVDPEFPPLRIRIRVRKTGDGSEITVEDDGPGFSPPSDEEPHLGINNVRNRIELMCGGTLLISPREGRGTTVTLRIPPDPNGERSLTVSQRSPMNSSDSG